MGQAHNRFAQNYAQVQPAMVGTWGRRAGRIASDSTHLTPCTPFVHVLAKPATMHYNIQARVGDYVLCGAFMQSMSAQAAGE